MGAVFLLPAPAAFKSQSYTMQFGCVCKRRPRVHNEVGADVLFRIGQGGIRTQGRGSQAIPKLALAEATPAKKAHPGVLPDQPGLLGLATITPAPNFDTPPVASDGTITGVYAGNKSAFSIHCYRSMLATDFAA